MTNTPNKGYNNQATGTNSGTWGIVLNQNFSAIDNNLGGTLTLGVGGNSNVALSTAQAQFLIYNFTGVLTENISITFPAAGGLYFINNETTGGFDITIQAGSSTSGFLAPQGQTPIYVDNSTNPPTIGGASGTQYVFTAGTVGGTANAVTVPSTLPSDFTLSPGTLLTFSATNFNTGSTTLQTPDGNVKTIQKVGSSGLINLQADDLTPGIPTILQYNGSVWIALNLVFYGTPIQQGGSFTLDFTGFQVPYIATASITVTLEPTSDYGIIFTTEFLALGGSVTLAPSGAETINGANANYTIPQGSSGKLQTDGAGNWWVYFESVPVNNPTFTGTLTAPVIQTTAGGNTLHDLVVQNGSTFEGGAFFQSVAEGVTPALGDSSINFATTAFCNPSFLNGGNGYFTYPSGSIRQWGGSATSGGTGNVTFPKPFTSGVYSIQLTPQGNTGVKAMATTTVSITGFTAFSWVNGAAGSTGFYWEAVGI